MDDSGKVIITQEDDGETETLWLTKGEALSLSAVLKKIAQSLPD